MVTNELYDFVHSGDLEATRKWLSVHPDDLNSDITDGYTPLHVASMFGHESIVSFLLAKQALVNLSAFNPSQVTALHLAVCFRDEEVACRIALNLIANGAELNAVQEKGQTALHHAIARGSLRLVEMLIDEGADPFFKDQLGRSPMDLVANLASDLDQDSKLRNALKRAFSLSLEARQ